MVNTFGNLFLFEDHIQYGVPFLCIGSLKDRRAVRLRIKINKQHPVIHIHKGIRHIYGGRCLRDAALLVRNYNLVCHNRLLFST